ncbi:MAG: ABC transporter substrate-binding protein [Gemmatimonadaceae bacterium]
MLEFIVATILDRVTTLPKCDALWMAALILLGACGRSGQQDSAALTFSGSALGAEGALLTRQLERFELANPDIDVQMLRTPEDATQRHQLYVQWLNARAGDPDVLQLDVVWTAEFAAAGWILPLDRFAPALSDFFPATVEANTWAGKLYGLPWFVDVGLLYRRTDLVPREPRSLDELVRFARAAQARPGGTRYGIVWQGARYEGLVTTFLEYLGAFGGRILDAQGRVVVHSPAGVRALTFMREALYAERIAPLDVLTWHEEETRFAFQNGNAAFMRNWPYAYAPMNDPVQSRVAGRFTVAPMPAAPGGRSTAALGGNQLAINANTESAEAAYRLIAYLTAPEQMLERATAVGQYPTRHALYDDGRLGTALATPVDQARRAIESATPRPVTPIYTELSEILQIELHRALVRQAEPEEALRSAARRINVLIDRTDVRRLITGRTP